LTKKKVVVLLTLNTANSYAIRLTTNSLRIKQLITALLAGNQLFKYEEDTTFVGFILPT
jgi:hypothetical protein